jgi:hypothetical protein
MKIDQEKFTKAISKLPDEPYKTVLYGENEKWLNEVGVPKELLDFFNEYSFKSFVKFNKVTFNSPNEIVHENTEEQNQKIYEQGLLIIGSGLNGDPIVVNLTNGNTGFVSHDSLWEQGETVDVNEIYKELNESLGSFFYKSMTDPEFPVDYYEACDFDDRNA